MTYHRFVSTVHSSLYRFMDIPLAAGKASKSNPITGSLSLDNNQNSVSLVWRGQLQYELFLIHVPKLETASSPTNSWTTQQGFCMPSSFVSISNLADSAWGQLSRVHSVCRNLLPDYLGRYAVGRYSMIWRRPDSAVSLMFHVCLGMT